MTVKHPLVWYEEQESGIDEVVLFDRLRQHGFVEGDYRNAEPELRTRITLLASTLMTDLVDSERKRAEDEAFERRVQARLAGML